MARAAAGPLAVALSVAAAGPLVATALSLSEPPSASAPFPPVSGASALIGSTASPRPAVLTDAGQVGVAVVVDFGNGSPALVRCINVNAGGTGLDALSAAFPTQFTSEGFVCTIDGYPADAQCPVTTGYRYWAYWHPAGGGSWSYSNVGAGFWNVSDHDVEGWSFQSGAQGSEANATPPGSSSDYASLCSAPAPSGPGGGSGDSGGGSGNGAGGGPGPASGGSASGAPGGGSPSSAPSDGTAPSTSDGSPGAAGGTTAPGGIPTSTGAAPASGAGTTPSTATPGSPGSPGSPTTGSTATTTGKGGGSTSSTSQGNGRFFHRGTAGKQRSAETRSVALGPTTNSSATGGGGSGGGDTLPLLLGALAVVGLAAGAIWRWRARGKAA